MDGKVKTQLQKCSIPLKCVVSIGHAFATQLQKKGLFIGGQFWCRLDVWTMDPNAKDFILLPHALTESLDPKKSIAHYFIF